ncbi:MAG TPA: histidinol-phosphate transaminase [Gammaproteobacteria bacterium]|nr:histidinol-phosphate transaminase [Gammaproteobacteria bacterium]
MDSSEKIKRLVRPEIQALTPYHVPDPGKLIKLDAMENPWTWPESLHADWCAALQSIALNRYPDPGARELQAAMRGAMEVPEAAAVILGNGSDELIQMIIQTVAAPGRVVMAPEPTFVMYRQLALVAGMSFAGVPLREDFSLGAAAMLEAIAVHRPAVIFLAFPNNPTGNLFDAGVIRQVLDAAPGLVVVDEAYAPFTDASFMPALETHDNLLVLRTVSKMGLAGLRLGLLAGAPAWLEQIDKTRLPYNLGSLNQATGRFALQHKSVFDLQAGLIRQDRADLLAGLQALPQLTVYPSEANFILFRVPGGQAPMIHAGLRDAGILVKILDGSAAPLADCLRVTVGTAGENSAFLKALSGLL